MASKLFAWHALETECESHHQSALRFAAGHCPAFVATNRLSRCIEPQAAAGCGCLSRCSLGSVDVAYFGRESREPAFYALSHRLCSQGLPYQITLKAPYVTRASPEGEGARAFAGRFGDCTGN